MISGKVAKTTCYVAKAASIREKTIILDGAKHVPQGAEEVRVEGARDRTGLGGFVDFMTGSFKGYGSL